MREYNVNIKQVYTNKTPELCFKFSTSLPLSRNTDSYIALPFGELIAVYIFDNSFFFVNRKYFVILTPLSTTKPVYILHQ